MEAKHAFEFYSGFLKEATDTDRSDILDHSKQEQKAYRRQYFTDMYSLPQPLIKTTYYQEINRATIEQVKDSKGSQLYQFNK